MEPMEQRGSWTDERMDDLSRRMDAGFGSVDRQFEQVDRLFEQVDRRFELLSRDIRDVRAELSMQIEGLRQTMIRVGGGMMLGFISILAAIVART